MFLSEQGFVHFGIAGEFCLGPAIGGGLLQVCMHVEFSDCCSSVVCENVCTLSSSHKAVCL